jgi:hypothetical protein
VDGGELGADGGDESVAHGLNFFHDGAGEGERWQRAAAGRLLYAADDDADEPGELFAFLAEDFGSYWIALVGVVEDDFGEAGEVGRGAGVGVLDEEVDGG